MSFPSIVNRGEFFSNHYLEAVISGDLNDLRSQWDDLEGKDMTTARFGVRAMRSKYFDSRAIAADTKLATTPELVDLVINALGFTPERQTLELVRNTTDQLDVPVVAEVSTSTGRLLVAIEISGADSLDDILDTTADAQQGRLVNQVWRTGDKKAVNRVQPAVNEIFGVDEPPRFVLVTTGRFVLLAERAKWAEGRFLAVDLDAALERNDAKKKGELETIAALFSADALTPGGPAAGEDGAGGQSVLDELSDKSQKHAVGVSKELRHGIRESIEILANEVIEQRRNAGLAVYQGENAVDAKQLTRQCLRWIYRLVVLLYAESRTELGVLPVNDEAYVSGYSLDRLRELTLVELDTERSQTGSHLHESLNMLFDLVNNGRHTDERQTADRAMIAEDGVVTGEEYLQFPGLDAVLFSQDATPYLNSVTLRNEAVQRVLKLLTYSAGKGKNAAGFISYAQLGINQLGAVYEGLMAYTGFFADEPLYEVAKGGDPEGGTWVLPTTKADDYPDDVFVTRTDEHGRTERILHDKGSFVFRLSGRDRQRSASFYTPEVLTRCVVKHALAELLGLDDYAPEGGSMGIAEAAQLLDITICEPALGSGAFANEAINQLSAEYLKMAQIESGETLDPERYRLELQKVKAHFALHQTYGVDLNATAVELAEVSLWLNAMYPGLKAPWFGLQLRQGNSLIGCRRATWTASQLQDKPWAQTKKGQVKPPEDRKLSEQLAPDEIHHFLLPGHGWAAVADRKEAKELRPDEVAELKQWRKTMLASPKPADEKRLVALAQAVEEAWVQATQRIQFVQKGLRRPIDIYGVEDPGAIATTSREQAEKALNDPNSPLGRLRTLMDAWIGLWYWPLGTETKPPTWEQWLTVAEELVRPEERHGPTGQLDLFDDLKHLVEAQQRLALGQASIDELKERHPWLDMAVGVARREAAFHWDLEFAPIFEQGGFDLQVGNPPWVRLDWNDDLVLAEQDPWWGVVDKPSPAVQKMRRAGVLVEIVNQTSYVSELAFAQGTTELLGSVLFRSILSGVRTNLYMAFMDTTWRHLGPNGVIGLIHPESHFNDPKAAELRSNAYLHLRRHWQFENGRMLFDEMQDRNAYGAFISTRPSVEPAFYQISSVTFPETVEGSLVHDGSGPLPGIKFPNGAWDHRPHRARVIAVDRAVLADWAKLFDAPGTPANEARLVRPVTTADLESLSVLADQPVRLSDHDYRWTHGWNETNAKKDGSIEWCTAVTESWDQVILQGPHFTVATPFAKQPNIDCSGKDDYCDWDLEELAISAIPRTNYQRACAAAEYVARLDQWNEQPYTTVARFVWRRMTQPGSERSLQGALIAPGPAHVHTVHTLALENDRSTALLAGLWSSLPIDYLVKVSGKADIQDEMIARFPTIGVGALESAVLLRTLRLNCLTENYAQIWQAAWCVDWEKDAWTQPHLAKDSLDMARSTWSVETPLRRDSDRRMALIELDALAALMLGLSAEQLCAMYRTQFAVLRKYEYKMVFDAEGRKICGYHQSAGYRQSTLQDQAKSGEGDLPKEWSNLWKLYEQYEEDPESVDWLGHYTAPFRRADREAEMTHAYNEFQRRLDAGEYAS